MATTTMKKPRAPNPNLIPVKHVAKKDAPDERWTIYRHKQTGLLSCNCGEWVFNPICGLCGQRLAKEKFGDAPTRFRCTTHGVAGAGPATRACKHILAHLLDEAKPKAAQGKVHNIGKGQGIALVDAAVGEVLSALLVAADAEQVRDRLFERQWRGIAKRMAARLGTTSGAVLEQATLDYDGVRTIFLED